MNYFNLQLKPDFLEIFNQECHAGQITILRYLLRNLEKPACKAEDSAQLLWEEERIGKLLAILYW